MYGDLKATRAVCGKDSRLHVVGPRRRIARPCRRLDRGHRRVRLFPRHRGARSPTAARPRRRRGRDVPPRRRYGIAAWQRAGASCPTHHQWLRLRSRMRDYRRRRANGRKNALQADPTAAGESGAVAVTKAYVGDIDGKYWRFNFTPAGMITAQTRWSTPASRSTHRRRCCLSAPPTCTCSLRPAAICCQQRARRDRHVQVVWLEGQPPGAARPRSSRSIWRR